MKSKLKFFTTALLALIFSAAPTFAANPCFSTVWSPYYDDLYSVSYDGNVNSNIYKHSNDKLNILLINGNAVDTDIIINNNRAMLPVRFVSEEMGYSVDWNSSDRTVTITSADNKAIFTIGKNSVVKNGNSSTIDAAPIIINSKTYLPVRAVSEFMGASVDYFNYSEATAQCVSLIFIESSDIKANVSIDDAKSKVETLVNDVVNTPETTYEYLTLHNYTINIFYTQSLGRYYMFNILNYNGNPYENKILVDKITGDTYSLYTGYSLGGVSINKSLMSIEVVFA